MNVVLFESIVDGDTHFNAWGKARMDALQIALNKGYKHVNFYTIGLIKPSVAFGAEQAFVVLDASSRFGGAV